MKPEKFKQTNIVHSILYKKSAIKYFSFILFYLIAFQINAQVKLPADSLKMQQDSVIVDSLALKAKNSNQLESPVSYAAKDSMMFSVKSKMIFAYGEAKIGMEEMKLDAGYIKMNIDSNYLFAKSFIDQNGKEVGQPAFTEGDAKYDIKTINYNLKSKKAYVTGVVTEMNGGYMQAKYTKMQPNKEIHLADGKFSTCDAEHPHFYIKLTKAKVIPEKKIVSGPFYFVISDIPLPVGLPFGYFPNQNKRSSGIIIPTYGEEKQRGFYLSQGGYYLALSDYVDLTLLGEIYTSGSWGLTMRSNYKKRYKYNGSLDLTYNSVVSGDKDLQSVPGEYSKSNTYSIKINYTRDPKAIPNASFNTAVNYRSSNYSQYNASNQNYGSNNTERFENSTTSSIAYQKSWPGTPFQFSANMSADQNLSSHQISLDLPTIALNMTTQHPLRKINNSPKGKWYKEISVGFSANLKNSLKTTDSLLFTQESLNKMSNGLQYKVPIGTSIKILKHFNLSPNINFTGRIYSTSLNKRELFESEIHGKDTLMAGEFYTDTVRGFNHVYDFSFGTPLSTKLYGQVNFEKGKIEAIRHVMTPTVSFNYKPDYADERWEYYAWDPEYPDEYDRRYNRFQNGIYGSPSAGKSGSIGLGLDNNFEMKTRTGDTAEPTKKIVLLSRLGFSTSYNLAADSIPWSPIAINASTKFFKQVNASYNSNFVIYDVNKDGLPINTPYLKNHRGLGRFTRHNLSLSGSINSETFKKKKDAEKKENQNEVVPPLMSDIEKSPFENKTGPEKEKDDTKVDEDGYSFEIPWNLSINYTFSFANNYNKTIQSYETKITQTLGLNGTFTLTKKWNIGAGAAYDFDQKQFSGANMSISRDLHCWQMGVNFIPFGKWQSYSFRISIKSSMLKGMEYKKQKSWADNF